MPSPLEGPSIWDTTIRDFRQETGRHLDFAERGGIIRIRGGIRNGKPLVYKLVLDTATLSELANWPIDPDYQPDVPFALPGEHAIRKTLDEIEESAHRNRTKERCLD